MDYTVIIDTVTRLKAQGWRTAEIASADGYPIFALESPANSSAPDDRPALLIDAGIHGEEPAGVMGLLAWLHDHAPAWLDDIRFTVLPCLNPWGFERGIRYDSTEADLNRQFNAPQNPMVSGVIGYLGERRFDLVMDLHEDCDFWEMYLYEVRVPGTPAQSPTLGRRILNHAKAHVDLSDGEDVGRMNTVNGMVGGDLDLDELDNWDELPIALYLLGRHAPHVITVETPGMQPLPTRTSLHVLALEEACRHVTAGGV